MICACDIIGDGDCNDIGDGCNDIGDDCHDTDDD